MILSTSGTAVPSLMYFSSLHTTACFPVLGLASQYVGEAKCNLTSENAQQRHTHSRVVFSQGHNDHLRNNQQHHLAVDSSNGEVNFQPFLRIETVWISYR